MNDVYKWYNFNTFRFEFDPEKSRSNMNKHGIDFVEAQQLWEDPDRLIGPTRTTDEPRRIVIGKIGNKHWTAIVTFRGDDRIRIISVRRARKKEISRYEDKSQGPRRKV